MKLRRPGLWLGITSALLVTLVVWSDRSRNSPGPLSATHAQDPALAGNGCEQCHGSGAKDMAAACAACHADIEAEISGKRGLHGHLPGDPEDCAACHVEHHGRDVALVGKPSFVLAGFADRDAYDHNGLDFRLGGRHAALACKDCHEQAEIEVLPKGSKRFLGLDQACKTCHEDVHQGKLPDCASCHGEEHPFSKVANFAHTAAFPLSAAHAAPACRDCHPKEGPRSIEADAAARSSAGKAALPDRACQDCHASPHTQAFLATTAKALRVQANASCASCHPTSHATFVGKDALLSKTQHAATGFRLEAPHDVATCEQCHLPGSADFAAAHPGRKPDDCAACHVDPHAGQFRGRGCLECHERKHFEPTTFGLLAHAKTAFPLTESHAAVPCARCHADPKAARGAKEKPARVFHGTDAACASCHVDAHQGAFERGGVLSDAERARGCATCHGASTFATLAAEFDHGKRTGFALEGAHATTECTSCHAPTPRADASGRSFGRAPVGVTPGSCHVCHADPHGGAFDRKGAPESVAGRVDCARCHTTESFLDTEKSFDHAQWTGYALDGAHAKLACASCHETARAAGTDALVLAPARGMDCAACHADPHVGQFAEAGRTDCARCHAVDGKFEEVRFDHDRDSRFRLDEGHRKLACGACHVLVPLEGGATAVRYKPLGTSCADCHDARRTRPR